MMAWQLFWNPMQMGQDALWLVLPLCAVVGVVYKTVRVQTLRQLPLAVLGLWLYMLVGLSCLAVALYVLIEYVA
jgi:hypothetical protein